MAPKLLADFTLPITLDMFLTLFWVEREWYDAFMRDKLENLEIEIADWEASASKDVMTRHIKSYHPSKISFPGLPSYAEVRCSFLCLFLVSSSSPPLPPSPRA